MESPMRTAYVWKRHPKLGKRPSKFTTPSTTNHWLIMYIYICCTIAWYGNIYIVLLNIWILKNISKYLYICVYFINILYKWLCYMYKTDIHWWSSSMFFILVQATCLGSVEHIQIFSYLKSPRSPWNYMFPRESQHTLEHTPRHPEMKGIPS